MRDSFGLLWLCPGANQVLTAHEALEAATVERVKVAHIATRALVGNGGANINFVRELSGAYVGHPPNSSLVSLLPSSFHRVVATLPERSVAIGQQSLASAWRSAGPRLVRSRNSFQVHQIVIQIRRLHSRDRDQRHGRAGAVGQEDDQRFDMRQRPCWCC